MRVDSLKIQNFRNIKSIDVATGDDLVLVNGQNAQGKTSFLEAVWMLTGAKSFRGGRDADLINHDERHARVQGAAKGFGKSKDIHIDVFNAHNNKSGRFAKINGVDYGRASEIAGQFTAVVFFPDHLRLVKGGPARRRRFVDTALCQLYPGYVGVLRRYTRTLNQKNKLLKIYHTSADADILLDVYDEKLVNFGLEIINRRELFWNSVGRKTEVYYDEITGGRENCRIQYLAANRKNELETRIREARERDIRLGHSTVGPHREDVRIDINGESARTFGSQGQQRSAVLCLKLAEAEFIKEVTREHPVMLLDDVLSELDASRQEYLLTKMNGMQRFISSCDEMDFSHGLTLKMKEGRLIEN